MDEKEIKKELATFKRKITQTAGLIHDIVEDSLWEEYAQLPKLSEEIQIQMREMLDFKSKYDFLK